MANDQSKLEKEEFEKSFSDEELITQINAWEEETEDFYSRLKNVWKQNLDYYHGIQTGVETIRGKQSKAVENRIYMATETMIPIATSRLPDIEVRAGDEDEQSEMDADDLKDVLGVKMEETGIQAKAELFVRNMILKRYGVFKVDWDITKDDVDLKVVDPQRIRVPKFGKDVRALKFVIEDLEMSYDQIVDKFSKKKAQEVLAQGRTDESEQKVRKKTFTIKEVWTNDLVVWRAGNTILDKKPNPFFESKNNFLLQSSKPYIIKSLFETDESLIGDTDYVQQMIPIQDAINKLQRQIEDISGKVSNPPLLIDSNVMSEEKASNITNEAGQIIYGKDAADGTKIRFETPGQVPNHLFLAVESLRSQFDNIWGIHSTTRGERQGKETATGRQLLRSADLGRIDAVARQLERSLDEVAEWWTQLIKVFYTEEKTFSIMGEDGTRFIKRFSGKKVQKSVKPRVVAGSTLPKDEITQRQEAIQLWQLGAIGVRTLYKRLKMSNTQDALDDFIETKSGRILQSQGGGTPVEGDVPVETTTTPPTVQPQA